MPLLGNGVTEFEPQQKELRKALDAYETISFATSENEESVSCFFSFSPDFSFSSLRHKEEKEKKGNFRTQMKF